MIVNVVHPYVYRLYGDALVFGEIPQFRERDRNIRNLIATTLEVGKKVNWFQEVVGRAEVTFSIASIKDDPLLGILGDPRVAMVFTDISGTPFSEKDLHFEGEQLFLGGLVERCLAHTIELYALRRKYTSKFYYLPELSVSYSREELTGVEETFSSLGVFPLGYEEALKKIAQ